MRQITNLSDSEFDALMDAMPQSARNQVLAQMRRGEGVKPPAKHDLRKQKQERTQVTKEDLAELEQYLYDVHGIDLLTPMPEPLSAAEWAALVEPVPVPKPEPNSQQEQASAATGRPSVSTLIGLVVCLLAWLIDPVIGLVVTLTLLLVATVIATVGKIRI